MGGFVIERASENLAAIDLEGRCRARMQDLASHGQAAPAMPGLVALTLSLTAISPRSGSACYAYDHLRIVPPGYSLPREAGGYHVCGAVAVAQDGLLMVRYDSLMVGAGPASAPYVAELARTLFGEPPAGLGKSFVAVTGTLHRNLTTEPRLVAHAREWILRDPTPALASCRAELEMTEQMRRIEPRGATSVRSGL